MKKLIHNTITSDQVTNTEIICKNNTYTMRHRYKIIKNISKTSLHERFFLKLN